MSEKADLEIVEVEGDHVVLQIRFPAWVDNDDRYEVVEELERRGYEVVQVSQDVFRVYAPRGGDAEA